MANKNGVILEHRLVMSEHLARHLTKDEIVHHINEDQRDNRIENLELTNSSDHARHHKAKGETMVDITCACCGEVEARPVRNIRTKQKQGQKHFYCSRKCMARKFTGRKINGGTYD